MLWKDQYWRVNILLLGSNPFGTETSSLAALVGAVSGKEILTIIIGGDDNEHEVSVSKYTKHFHAYYYF